MTYRDQPLGVLAVDIPRATRLFRQYDLDFCCGGKQTLLRAVTKKDLDIDVIEQQIAEIAAQPETSANWQTAPLADLIDFIIPRFHDRHRKELPELVLMAEKVERVHADKAPCPHGLAVQLQRILDELSSHMMKEEQILFPMIRAGMGSHASGPISVMESEHESAGKILEEIQRLTNNVTPPEGACVTWRALYAGINEFITDLMEHIHLENNLLFPRALRGV
ncbi:iron-sulfur cluster repair protein YtfE [Hafnia psychrotolerans]|uniref:Iron-sulfur cluster repair protein YtfE n=1 Tax=Hafnia psychrotolerans TaxID=1477018 RepID=A0ABQ1H3D8_9GAMM|nr:iron-sulfur cluster repair protein YtfE [Hafnia psychrotolerans]GGA56192.1 iron-sulfur cluster repair protein YtfE [Hafnia psychrotolerans]